MNQLIPLLNVEDASRSVRFYVDHFGFEVDRTFEPEGTLRWAQIQRGSIKLMINQSDVRMRQGSRRSTATYDDVVLYFAVDDARKLRDELVQRGVEAGEVERQSYGVDEFTLRDPDGYELAFSSWVTE